MTTVKLFWSGGFQTVPLPQAFGMEGEEVRIWRQGDAVIPEPLARDWAWLDAQAGRLDSDAVEAALERPRPNER